MNVPWQSGRHGRGVLLLRGEPEQVARWAARGIVASRVVPLPSWTAVLPAEPASRAMPPYDDALTVLALRPVAHRLRAAVGLFAIDGRAVVTVQGDGWRAVQRWLIWQPGQGLTRPSGLRPARPADLVATARAGTRGAGSELSALLRDPRGDALGLLSDVMSVLGLPGSALLTHAPADGVEAEGDGRGGDAGRLVEPHPAGVAAFDALMLDEARNRAELEED